MLELLESFKDLHWAVGAISMMAIFILASCTVIFLIRRFIDPRILRSHHDVAAVVFANLGVLYSVLLGFTVVNVQQRFDKIKENTEVEASYLVDLYRDAEVFEPRDRERIRTALVEYSRSVVEKEWPEMAEGDIKDTVNLQLGEVWNAYYELKTTNHKQDQWYSVSISKLNLLMNARLSRLLGSHESLGAEMWTMLFFGAIAVVTFICFFSLESLVSHWLMAAVLAGITGFLLFLVYSLDTAFSGNISISPVALEEFIKYFEN